MVWAANTMVSGVRVTARGVADGVHDTVNMTKPWIMGPYRGSADVYTLTHTTYSSIRTHVHMHTVCIHYDSR